MKRWPTMPLGEVAPMVVSPELPVFTVNTAEVLPIPPCLLTSKPPTTS